MEEAVRLLAEAGIDVEDIKRRISSGEWFVVEGDSECVLDVVAVTLHSAVLLFVAGDSAVCLAKKSEAFKASTGLDDEVVKRLVWVHVKRVPTGCAATAWTEKDVEKAGEEVARELVEAVRRALELVKRQDPSYTQ
jgi:hypothetical protein